MGFYVDSVQRNIHVNRGPAGLGFDFVIPVGVVSASQILIYWNSTAAGAGPYCADWSSGPNSIGQPPWNLGRHGCPPPTLISNAPGSIDGTSTSATDFTNFSDAVAAAAGGLFKTLATVDVTWQAIPGFRVYFDVQKMSILCNLFEFHPGNPIADVFNDILVAAVLWYSGGSTASIDIQISRGPLKVPTIAESYTYGVCDPADIGLCFLPNGNLVLTYFIEGAAVYVVNKKFGTGPKENWSDPLSLTPEVAAMLNVGRGMGQAHTCRIG